MLFEMNLCFQTAPLAGMVLDVPSHVVGVRQGMCVTMWTVFVREHVNPDTRRTGVTRVSHCMYIQYTY